MKDIIEKLVTLSKWFFVLTALANAIKYFKEEYERLNPFDEVISSQPHAVTDQEIEDND